MWYGSYMIAEDLIKRWAAARLDIPVKSVLRVDFEKTEEHWYSEVTCDPAADLALVQLDPDYDWGPSGYPSTSGRIDVSDLTLAEFLEEVLQYA